MDRNKNRNRNTSTNINPFIMVEIANTFFDLMEEDIKKRKENTKPMEDTKTREIRRNNFLKGTFDMIGTTVGGTASAFYGVNRAMPVFHSYPKGFLKPLFITLPFLLLFSSTCAGLGGSAGSAIADSLIRKPTLSSEAAERQTPSSLGDEITESETSLVL